MLKKVLITGVTGQDGAFLAAKLIDKGYQVYGTVRRGSTPKAGRLKQLNILDRVTLVSLELSEITNVITILRDIKPNYIYNLAAQSFVADSFVHPHLTTEINYLGYLNLLEAVRMLQLECNIYQASTSEMYGDVLGNPQNERTPFNPMSPYAVAKCSAHYLGCNYRAAYDMHVCNGILFNHESELRGREFVTRKITSELAKIKYNKANPVKLGNLDSVRDWGYAADFVDGMILINEAEVADDFVIATNTKNTVRDFFKFAAIATGFTPVFSGEGLNEICYCDKSGETLCEVDPKYFRPSDVVYLCGDYKKINEKLSWSPKTSLEQMIEKMVRSDCEMVKSNRRWSF